MTGSAFSARLFFDLFYFFLITIIPQKQGITSLFS